MDYNDTKIYINQNTLIPNGELQANWYSIRD